MAGLSPLPCSTFRSSSSRTGLMRAGYSCTSGARYTLSGLISCGGRYSSGIMLITPSVVDRPAPTKEAAGAASLAQPPSEARCQPRLLLGLLLSLGDHSRRGPVLRDQVLQGSPDADEPLLPVAPWIGVGRVPVGSIFVDVQGRTRSTEVGFQ